MIRKAMKQVGSIFGAPMVIEGKTWFPVVPLIAWGILTWITGRQHLFLLYLAVPHWGLPVV
jgi:hypothetical protein